MGAGKADGGKRGWWWQARPMGAVRHWATSLVSSCWPSSRVTEQNMLFEIFAQKLQLFWQRLIIKKLFQDFEA